MGDTMKEPCFELVRHHVIAEQLAVLPVAEETDPWH